MRNLAATDRDGRLGGTAPRFLVIYCSVMIILLAFFILMQTMSTGKQKTKFRRGQGSFIRALDTYGLGRVMGRRLPEQFRGPRMPRRYGRQDQQFGDDHAANPEVRAAKKAWRELSRTLDSGSSLPSGRRVMMALPLSGDKETMTDRQRAYLERFATGLLPSLLGRQCIVNVAVLYPSAGDRELKPARRAGRTARAVRRLILEMVPTEMTDRARRRTYSSCRPARRPGPRAVRLGILIPQDSQK